MLRNLLTYFGAGSGTVGRPGPFGPGARLVLLVHTLFLLGVHLSNTFVNIFLFEVGESLVLIGWYHLYQFVAIAAGFVLAGRIAEYRDRTVALRIGIALHAAFYFAILLLGPGAAQFVAALGILLGLGTGFYWIGNQTLSFDLTRDRNRDAFNGASHAAAALVTMIAPFVAGAVIATLPDRTGYRLIFGGSLFLFVGSVAISLLLRRRPSDRRFELGRAIRAKANPRWRQIMWIQVLNGFQTGVFTFFVGLLFFIVTGSEFAVGTFSAVTGALTLITSWVVGRAGSPDNRPRTLGIGLLGTSLPFVLLALTLNPLGILLFGALQAIFAPMYGIPFEAVNYRILDRDPAASSLRVEYLIAREIPLNVGRVAGVITFIAAAPHLLESDLALGAFVLVLGLTPLVTWRALRRLAE